MTKPEATIDRWHFENFIKEFTTIYASDGHKKYGTKQMGLTLHGFKVLHNGKKLYVGRDLDKAVAVYDSVFAEAERKEKETGSLSEHRLSKIPKLPTRRR